MGELPFGEDMCTQILFYKKGVKSLLFFIFSSN